jgi:hypothetical protein
MVYQTPYEQAREAVDQFKAWHSGTRVGPGSSETYEGNFSTKMREREWIRLKNDLDIFETDEGSKLLLQNHPGCVWCC